MNAEAVPLLAGVSHFPRLSRAQAEASIFRRRSRAEAEAEVARVMSAASGALHCRRPGAR